MKKILIALFAVAVALVALPQKSHAGDFRISISAGTPGYGHYYHRRACPPRHYAPSRYYAPPRHYAPPRRYYYRPRPVYRVAPPVRYGHHPRYYRRHCR